MYVCVCVCVAIASMACHHCLADTHPLYFLTPLQLGCAAQWRDSRGVVYGLNFGAKESATSFALQVEAAIKHLNNPDGNAASGGARKKWRWVHRETDRDSENG